MLRSLIFLRPELPKHCMSAMLLGALRASRTASSLDPAESMKYVGTGTIFWPLIYSSSSFKLFSASDVPAGCYLDHHLDHPNHLLHRPQSCKILTPTYLPVD